MWKSKTFSNFKWCGCWINGAVGSWTTWFLDFNRRVASNKRGRAKFGPFLIQVVAEITYLWVENSQKINCRDVTSIREGRVTNQIFFFLMLCYRRNLMCFFDYLIFWSFVSLAAFLSLMFRFVPKQYWYLKECIWFKNLLFFKKGIATQNTLASLYSIF